jgi:hypothetical protein
VVIAGIDPDLTTPAVAVIDTDNHVYAVDCIRVKRTRGEDPWIALNAALSDYFKDIAARWLPSLPLTPRVLAVEGQEMYMHGAARKQDIAKLAFSAGMVAGRFCREFPSANLLVPLPKAWKGGQPKEINQARTCRHFGWGVDPAKGYVVPVEERVLFPQRGFRRSDWKHGLDALGIALWASKQSTGASSSRRFPTRPQAPQAGTS